MSLRAWPTSLRVPFPHHGPNQKPNSVIGVLSTGDEAMQDRLGTRAWPRCQKEVFGTTMGPVCLAPWHLVIGSWPMI